MADLWSACRDLRRTDAGLLLALAGGPEAPTDAERCRDTGKGGQLLKTLRDAARGGDEERKREKS